MPPISLHLPEWFVSGGATMWVLALLSVVALATLISKILQFARIRPGNSRQADQLLNALRQGKQPGEPAGKLNSPIDRETVIWTKRPGRKKACAWRAAAWMSCAAACGCWK